MKRNQSPVLENKGSPESRDSSKAYCWRCVKYTTYRQVTQERPVGAVFLPAVGSISVGRIITATKSAAVCATCGDRVMPAYETAAFERERRQTTERLWWVIAASLILWLIPPLTVPEEWRVGILLAKVGTFFFGFSWFLMNLFSGHRRFWSSLAYCGCLGLMDYQFINMPSSPPLREESAPADANVPPDNISSVARATAPVLKAGEHVYNEHGFCIRCGWAREAVLRDHRECLPIADTEKQTQRAITPAILPSASSSATNPFGSSENLTRYNSADDAKAAAVSMYPDLGVAGSKFNTEFIRRYRSYVESSPEYFMRSNWPVDLATEVAEAIRVSE